MKRMCVGGPADGMLVYDQLGDRWPWMMLGHYGVMYPIQWYEWDGENYVAREVEG